MSEPYIPIKRDAWFFAVTSLGVWALFLYKDKLEQSRLVELAKPNPNYAILKGEGLMIVLAIICSLCVLFGVTLSLLVSLHKWAKTKRAAD